MHYVESVDKSIRGGRGNSSLYIGCVNMPTVCMNSSIEGCYEKFKEDELSFKEKARVVLVGDFNAMQSCT